MSTGGISVVVDEPAWRTSGVSLSRVRSAARLALEMGLRGRKDAKKDTREAVILLASNERLRSLNAQFRNHDKATNVLSFPAPHAVSGHLGDVALAFGVASAESASSGISFEDHALHLVVHGILHLLGYDHLRAREAELMEQLEIAILDRLGIANPYQRNSSAR